MRRGGALLFAALAAAFGWACAAAFETTSRSATARAATEAQATLAAELDRLLDSRPFNRAMWGAEIVELRSGRTVYARNAHRHFIPASNMKLLVSAVALDRLGPDYTYRTSVYADGELREGVLAGDLVLYGRGDPNISGRYAPSPTAIFAALADSLKARGLQQVAGRVVADESYFDADYTRPDWEAYDLLWWYAASVSALSFNDNSIDFTIRPGPVGASPVITAEPASGYYELRNTARTVERPDSTSVTLDFTRLPGSNRIVAYGELAADAKEQTESFAVVSPAAFAGTVFRETLEAAGVAVADDSVVVVSDPAASAVDSLALLAEHVSPPLEKVIFSINQRSQNLHAEQLLKTLGKVVRGEGSFAAGIAVERAFLDAIGVEPDAVYIRDASGLSDGNLVTPNALVTLLRHMLHHPQGKVFFASLPVAGQAEGSLRARFSNSPVSGTVHGKTGSIRHVNTLSGYLVPAPGDTLAFSILANNHGLEGSQVVAAIDSAVTLVVRGYQP